jgi:SIR2-like domain
VREEPPTERVLRELIRGRVSPFLGAGANLCGRPPGLEWSPGCGFYPSGAELALHLAERFRFEGSDRPNLMEVASFVLVMYGRGPLYLELHKVFDEDVPVSPLHRFLARARALTRRKDPLAPAPLIVTTNYDDALERALREVGEPYDVVAYMADRRFRGKFFHVRSDGERILIEHPSRYDGIRFDERAVILKIHGTIDRADEEWDSFVIAEEHYVEYLSTDVWDEIPVAVRAELARRRFLFLGYAMRDWNLLVILHRLGLLPHPQYGGWAIQLNQTEVDKYRWEGRFTESFDIPLDAFVEELDAALAEL